MQRRRSWTHALRNWPLLIVGIELILLGVFLTEYEGDPSDTRAALVAVGCVLIGVGIARVIYGPMRPPPKDDDHTDPI